jgi:hypothetical protein
MIMSGVTQTSSGPAAGFSRWQRVGPILTLIVLSPVIGEVLSGATRLSYIFVLVPEIMVWGCGTLIIRDVVRRWQGGWTSLLLLGFGLAIAEEFIIQQTSIAPLPWAGATSSYGRVWGVNWPYFLFMLGYEAIWIVLVPIQITELMFPARRQQAWLRTGGLVVASLVFLVGSFIAWFLWTQRARPMMFHVPVYRLAAGAYVIRHSWRDCLPGRPPPPWALVTIVLLLGLPWYSWMVLVFGPARNLPLLVPVVIGTTWAAGVFLLVRRWSLTSAWQDMHRWALCLGALLVCMIGGFLGASAWSPTDIVAKAVLNVIAVVGMANLAARIARRPEGQPVGPV